MCFATPCHHNVVPSLFLSASLATCCLHKMMIAPFYMSMRLLHLLSLCMVFPLSTIMDACFGPFCNKLSFTICLHHRAGCFFFGLCIFWMYGTKFFMYGMNAWAISRTSHRFPHGLLLLCIDIGFLLLTWPLFPKPVYSNAFFIGSLQVRENKDGHAANGRIECKGFAKRTM